MPPTHPIPDAEWARIVRHVPIASVDLVVHHEDGVVLGKRTNEPAKGEWFVPGGMIQKGETREEAVQRVASEELGTTVTIENSLGTFEHFYETSDVEGVESKHYLASGYAVIPEADRLEPDDQHGELRVFSPPFPDLHPYVEQYLEAAGLLCTNENGGSGSGG